MINATFRELLAIGRPHYTRLLLGIVAMALSGVVTIWPTYALKLVTDMLVAGGDFREPVLLSLIPQQLLQYGLPSWTVQVVPLALINWVPLLLLLLLTLDGFLRFLTMYHSRFFSVLVANDLREKVHQRLLQVKLPEIQKRKSGDISSCLTNDLNLIQSLLAEVMNCLAKDLTSALVFAVWLLLLSWKLSIIGALVLPPFLFGISKLVRKLRQLANQGQEATGRLASFITESVQGADLIHLFSLYDYRHQQFLGENRHFQEVRRRELFLDAMLSPLLGIMSALGIGFVAIWFGLREVLENQMTVGDFSAYLVGTVLLYQPIKRLLRVNSQINQITGNCQRIFALAELPTEEQATTRPNASNRSGALNLSFEGVSFAYQAGQDVLQEISFQIAEGEQVALVGASGSGKSTLVRLIPRLYEVHRGRIRLQGQDLQDWVLGELRAQLSSVTQECFLFSGTLRDNLLLAKPTASETELKRVLEWAKVDFLGLEEAIGERGNTLSGGQRQRIAIARAFLKDSPILLLDEPTSSLDQQSEELIKSSIFDLMRNRTVLLVTHKLSLIRSLPRILCFQAGHLVEEGSHQSLLQARGYYYQLATADTSPAQSGSFTLPHGENHPEAAQHGGNPEDLQQRNPEDL